MQKGDIYLVNFDPSVGHEFQKIRPAVIIQDTDQIIKSNLVTVMPLTSNVSNKISGDIPVATSSQNNLFAASIVKVFCISSFDKTRLAKKVGTMEQEVMKRVEAYLRIHFGLE